MNIQDIANWLRGYLKPLSNNDNICKQQILILTPKLEDLVSKLEEYENDHHDHGWGLEDKDIMNRLYGYLESLSYNNNISKEQIQILLPKMEELISKMEYCYLNFQTYNEYKPIANWLRGHLESLSYNDNISIEQIQILLPKIEEIISEIEKHENGGGNEDKHLANRLYGYLESLNYSNNISIEQIQILLSKMEELVSEIKKYNYEQNYEDRNTANWLRGYLESISFSDKISNEQIQITLPKIEKLISTVKEYNIHDGSIADRLSGYLESLSNSGNISTRQIQILMSKLEELASAVEEYRSASKKEDTIDFNRAPWEEDDLPF